MIDQWKLVPIVPTDDMVIDGFEAVYEFKHTDEFSEMSGCRGASESAKVCYAAMLAACPAEPLPPMDEGADIWLISRVWQQFRKDACIPGDDRVSVSFIKAARVLMGADSADAARYRWLSKRVVITDGSTPGLMVITVVDDGIEAGNQFLDEFTERALASTGAKP